MSKLASFSQCPPLIYVVLRCHRCRQKVAIHRRCGEGVIVCPPCKSPVGFVHGCGIVNVHTEETGLPVDIVQMRTVAS